MKNSIYLCIYLFISLNGQVIQSNEIEKGTGVQRSASFNVEEIKDRWKKAALENCPGIPCIVTPPASSCLTPIITDVDGNVYNTVSIGTQCWTKENLRVRKYSDGTDIPFNASGGSGGSVSSTWNALAIGVHTIYAHDSTATTGNLAKYGFLYNYYAAAGIITAGGTSTKNICPTGYHVPTDAEWTTLTTFLGGESVAGGKMKQIGTTLWNTPNTGTDNTSNFTGLPGGFRDGDGSFYDDRNYAFFWSATEYDGIYAWFRFLDTDAGIVSRNYSNKSVGASVRCLRD